MALVTRPFLVPSQSLRDSLIIGNANHVVYLFPSRCFLRSLLRISSLLNLLVPPTPLLAALLSSSHLASPTPSLLMTSPTSFSNLASLAPFPLASLAPFSLASLMPFFHLASLTPSHLPSLVPSHLASPVPCQAKSFRHLIVQIHLSLSPLTHHPPRFLLRRLSIPPASVVLSRCILTLVLSTLSVTSQPMELGLDTKVASMFKCADPTTSQLMPTLQLCRMQFIRSSQSKEFSRCINYPTVISVPLSASSPNEPMASKPAGGLYWICLVLMVDPSMTASSPITAPYPTRHCILQFGW